MSNFNSDGSQENEWDDRGELAWNEFDWERYLREQDDAVTRYLALYEAAKGDPVRIDTVAEKMGWGQDDWTDEAGGINAEDDDEEDDDEDDADFDDDDVYTLHKNPIFIATKAINLGLRRSWEKLAADPANAPQPVAVSLLASLHRGEEHSVEAINALDFGDYAMAVSLLKRAMSALNGTLALLNAESSLSHPAVAAWRDEALPQLFDLREICLRVIAECRDELDRPVDEES